MSDLTEALERAIPIFATGGLSNAMYRTDDPDEVEGYAVDTDDWLAISAAVRKWAELEALVADGGRVVVETRNPLWLRQYGSEWKRRIVLGEGAE